MDSLIAKADRLQPISKKRKLTRTRNESSGKEKAGNSKKPSTSSSTADATLSSVHFKTSVPRSLRSIPAPSTTKSHSHIKSRKLRLELDRKAEHNSRVKALKEDAEILTQAVGADAGRLEAEDEMERTWRVGQADIEQVVGRDAASQRREWKLDGGPYRSRYTRNGRSVYFFPLTLGMSADIHAFYVSGTSQS